MCAQLACRKGAVTISGSEPMSREVMPRSWLSR